MKIEKAVCPYCGAALKMHTAQKTVKCDYCGSVAIVTRNEALIKEGGPQKSGDAAREQTGGRPRGQTGPGQLPASERNWYESNTGPVPEKKRPVPVAGRKYVNTPGNTGVAGRLRSLFPPPGFRSGNIAHMITAAAGYLMIYSLAKSMNDPIESIFIFIASLSVVDVFTDWTGLCSRLPGLRSRSIIIRITMKLTWGCLIFFGWIVIMVIIRE